VHRRMRTAPIGKLEMGQRERTMIAVAQLRRLSPFSGPSKK
jgi:hypothetical protein